MAKAIVELPYGGIVMDAKDALVVAEIMSRAERYTTKWRNDNGGNTHTHHIYNFDVDTAAPAIVKLITDEMYNMYKLAGKPE